MTDFQGIRREEKVKLRYNKGTWHIFHPTMPRVQKALCHYIKKSEFSSNHGEKTRMVGSVLDNPDRGLGEVCTRCLKKLEVLVEKWDKQKELNKAGYFEVQQS